MKIVEIREKTLPISSPIRNAYIDFSKMTLSLVAVITDVIRDGKPVVGYGFNSNGRYGQGKLMRERFIPRVLEASPDSLIAEMHGVGVYKDIDQQRPLLLEGQRTAAAREFSRLLLDRLPAVLESFRVPEHGNQSIVHAFGRGYGAGSARPLVHVLKEMMVYGLLPCQAEARAMVNHIPVEEFSASVRRQVVLSLAQHRRVGKPELVAKNPSGIGVGVRHLSAGPNRGFAQSLPWSCAR